MLQKSATQLPFQTFSASEESFYRNMGGSGGGSIAAAAVEETQGCSFCSKVTVPLPYKPTRNVL